MLSIQYQSKFKKDVRLLKKRGYKLKLLEDVIKLLVLNKPLPKEYKDHGLTGNWIGYRECHIQNDWLLIYKIDHDVLLLTVTRTGTHSDLLGC